MVDYSKINFMTQEEFDQATKNPNELYAINGLNMIPSNRYVNLTLGASGTTYTAPANGWFSVNFKCSSTTSNNIVAIEYNLFQQYIRNNITDWRRGYIPVKKGNTCTLYYTGDFIQQRLLFVYSL